MTNKTLLESHNKLLTIVEAYIDVYRDDFKDTLLESELPKTLQNAKIIKNINENPFLRQ